MTSVLKTITREIATSLISEVIDYSSLAKPIEPANQMASRSQLRLSEITSRRLSGLSRIARDVRQLKENPQEQIPAETNVPVTEEVPQVGLDKVEEKLSKLFNKTENDEEQSDGDTDIEKMELDDFDDVDIKTIEKLEKRGYKVIYPNLKYRKPKYQNVNEMLKYVESDTGKGDGVKLVIMNFND